jgi:hypothetical protein
MLGPCPPKQRLDPATKYPLVAERSTTKYNEEGPHGHNNHSCEPHRYSSYGKTCYGPIDPTLQHSFMEEVSILTLSMFFIIIYLFCIMCIYIYFLLYVVLQLLRLSSEPSMLMDASVTSPTNDATIEATCSLGAPDTHVCVTFDKFTRSSFLYFMESSK